MKTTEALVASLLAEELNPDVNNLVRDIWVELKTMRDMLDVLDVRHARLVGQRIRKIEQLLTELAFKIAHNHR